MVKAAVSLPLVGLGRGPNGDSKIILQYPTDLTEPILQRCELLLYVIKFFAISVLSLLATLKEGELTLNILKGLLVDFIFGLFNTDGLLDRRKPFLSFRAKVVHLRVFGIFGKFEAVNLFSDIFEGKVRLFL